MLLLKLKLLVIALCVHSDRKHVNFESAVFLRLIHPSLDVDSSTKFKLKLTRVNFKTAVFLRLIHPSLDVDASTKFKLQLTQSDL